MKKIIVLMMVLFTISFATEVKAQKNDLKKVCFKSSMDCDHCEKTLTDYLKFEKGVKNLKVDLATNTILIEYKEGKNTDDAFAKAIKKKGYEANKITEKEYSELMKISSKEKE